MVALARAQRLGFLVGVRRSSAAALEWLLRLSRIRGHTIFRRVRGILHRDGDTPRLNGSTTAPREHLARSAPLLREYSSDANVGWMLKYFHLILKLS